ncbi:MAG: RNA polymerase sigma factor [Bryobacteraceae bacterium]
MEELTDSSLMRLVQGGDSGQLAVLFERHHAGLFRYLMQLSRNRALSEDLTQEVFFRVLKYAGTYDPEFPFSVWIYRMGRNAFFDTLRSRSAEPISPETLEVRSREPMPEELFSRKQDRVFLEEALQTLSEEKREVLVLSRFHDLRYHEIAKIMKCEVNTVKVRVYRALRELREKFCELRGEKLYDV